MNVKNGICFVLRLISLLGHGAFSVNVARENCHNSVLGMYVGVDRALICWCVGWIIYLRVQ